VSSFLLADVLNNPKLENETIPILPLIDLISTYLSLNPAFIQKLDRFLAAAALVTHFYINMPCLVFLNNSEQLEDNSYAHN